MANVVGLENVREVKYFKKDGLAVIVVEYLYGAIGNYILTSVFLSEEEKENLESVRYYVSGPDTYRRLKGCGHGWTDEETGEKYTTSEGKIRFICKEPTFVLMEHNIPGVGKEYTLYLDNYFYENQMEVVIPNEPELSKMANMYREYKDENTISEKAYEKRLRQLKSGKITLEEFNEYVGGKQVIPTPQAPQDQKLVSDFDNTKPVAKTENSTPHAKIESPKVTTKPNADIGYELIALRREYEENLLKLYGDKISSLSETILELETAVLKAASILKDIKTANAEFDVEKEKLTEEYESKVSAVIKK